MKKEERRISTEMKLIFGIVIAILVCLVSVYIYNNYLVGRSFKDNIPLFTVGLLVIIISLLSFFAIWCLIGLLIVVLLDLYNSKRSKEQIKTMPNHFVNIYFKDFDNFRLSSFIDSEDITCFSSGWLWPRSCSKIPTFCCWTSPPRVSTAISRSCSPPY